MNTRINIENWKLVGPKTIDAHVPGDITYDHYLAGDMPDPFFEMNYQSAQKYLRQDFTYTAELTVPQVRPDKDYTLVFDGIDTFADIYLDEHFLGKTENMFLQYRFDVGSFLTPGKHVLKVRMHSALNVMEQADCKDYFGVFNTPRIFLRKAQCHFGWDWAPNLPGYGIWQDVYLLEQERCRIENVRYIAKNSGAVTFQVALNYNIRSRFDASGVEIKAGHEKKNDCLRVTVGDAQVCTAPVSGQTNFVNLFVEDAKLWYPLGYGQQPMYDYRVELLREGQTVDSYAGKLAFREVELLEQPIDKNSIGFAFRVNGKKVFVKGSNWVPTECFTGIAQNKRYRQLIDQAADAGINMLRVWGGGIYEKDIFYDLCDEKGIMVWQDFMFACSDIPEEDQAFMAKVLTECEYQIKRLRNHPSLVYWCGSNERVGSCCLSDSHGGFFVDVVLRGLVAHLDDTRPYQGTSPYSLTDVGSDITSGDCHNSSMEEALVKGMDNYRSMVAQRVVPFASECALLGPCSEESFRKFFGEKTLWPMNEVWVDRLSDNPCAAIYMPFCQRQMTYATELYGKPGSLSEFVSRGMQVQAECMRAEVEFLRANKDKCSGVMNWMFNDIWPTACWSVIDYYGEAKQAYYQMKRSFTPGLVTFIQNGLGQQELVLVNDREEEMQVCVEYGQKTPEGRLLWQERLTETVPGNGLRRHVIEKCEQKAYFFVWGTAAGKPVDSVYSPKMWKDIPLESDFTYTVRQITPNQAEVAVSAEKLAKAVYVAMPDNCRYTYSDNYIDVDAGRTRVVTVTCEDTFDVKEIKLTSFTK